MQTEKKYAVEVLAANQTLTYCEIKRVVDLCQEKGIKNLCLPQCFLKWVKNYTQNKFNLSTLIDYPNGHALTINKINAIKLAIKNGADEVDVAVNHCELKSGNVSHVEQELKQIRRALRGRLFKLYFNYSILNESELVVLNRLIQSCTVDYLVVDFYYSEEEFLGKLNDLKGIFGKKIKIKLNTNCNLENLKLLNLEEFDGRICIPSSRM